MSWASTKQAEKKEAQAPPRRDLSLGGIITKGGRKYRRLYFEGMVYDIPVSLLEVRERKNHG